MLGNSSGAVVALAVLQYHPDVVKTLIPHEPPAATLLPDRQAIQEHVQKIYSMYRAEGTPTAFRMLGEFVKLHEQEVIGLVEATNPKNSPYNFSNTQHFWEREANYYPFHEFDLDALEKQKGKLLLANSEMCDPEAIHYRPNLVLAKKFGLNVEYFPGGHLGYLTHSKDFAEKLVSVLTEKH